MNQALVFVLFFSLIHFLLFCFLPLSSQTELIISTFWFADSKHKSVPSCSGFNLNKSVFSITLKKGARRQTWDLFDFCLFSLTIAAP